MQHATCCVNMQAGKRIEMASANNQNNSSINENYISKPLLPPIVLNSSMPIGNNANESNEASSVSNGTTTPARNRIRSIYSD